MRTALPIPAFARATDRRVAHIQVGPRRQIPYHFAIGRTDDKLDWLFSAHPNAKIALVTIIPPAPAWHDIEA
jgi:hypothetical protein